MNNKGKLIVILGPTATGKTDLGLNLAKKFNGELIACDSRQVYKGLDIGTGKLPDKWRGAIKKGKWFWDIGEIRIWMYDVVYPKKQYTVAGYVKDTDKVIGKIREGGKLPIIVGGTGLYLKALLDGLPSLAVPVDKKLREQLEKLSLRQLQERIKLTSIKRWKKMNSSDRQNPRRLIRIIELAMSNKGEIPRLASLAWDDKLKVGLTAPREILYKRADERVVNRINQGMLEEAKSLHDSGLSLKRMKQLGLEYGVLADYLEGKINNKNDLITVMQGKIHGYIRRQLTWFKKEKDIYWFDITKINFFYQVEKLIRQWYHSTDA